MKALKYGGIKFTFKELGVQIVAKSQISCKLLIYSYFYILVLEMFLIANLPVELVTHNSSVNVTPSSSTNNRLIIVPSHNNASIRKYSDVTLS